MAKQTINRRNKKQQALQFPLMRALGACCRGRLPASPSQLRLLLLSPVTTRSNRFGLIRFGSVSCYYNHIFGSVRLGNWLFPVRRGSACAFRTRRVSVRFGSVRFGSASGSGRFRNSTVRFGSAGSVRFLIPPWWFIGWSNNHFNNLHFIIQLETNKY